MEGSWAGVCERECGPSTNENNERLLIRFFQSGNVLASYDSYVLLRTGGSAVKHPKMHLNDRWMKVDCSCDTWSNHLRHQPGCFGCREEERASSHCLFCLKERASH
ncbi:uncharacterized protein LOC111264710 [Varroa jacobsoni]|uniref:uncharacterized protein LOC111264710 n=1 Tax=Varroa jacobsoni TaxID=62625 RepID=UPI000BF7AED0|nr:uncharacterized protein LOC111264710 [Varroa jacobsoni]